MVGSATYVATTDIFTELKDLFEPNLRALYYFIFATLWTNALILAVGTFVIASSVVMWYYSHGPGA